MKTRQLSISSQEAEVGGAGAEEVGVGGWAEAGLETREGDQEGIKLEAHICLNFSILTCLFSVQNL